MTEESGRATSRVPPSYYRNHEFDDGDVEALAKLAMWKPGQPDRLYTYNAKEITVAGEEITPPSQYPDSSDWSTLRAFTLYDPETIVYFLENWSEEAEWGMVGALATIELHELAHLALDEEHDETDTDHWEPWNQTLSEAVDYVTDNGWEDIDLTPVEPESEDAELEQKTLVPDGGEEVGRGGSQASFIRFDPPRVDDPAAVLPGGWHHLVVFGYDHVAGFLAVDPADCEACRDRVYRRHGCVNGHLRRDMTDRALTSPPEVYGDA